MGTKLGKIKSESKQTFEITAEEYSLIKATWTRIEFEPKVHGPGFFLKFFATHPQYVKYYLTDSDKVNVNPDALMVVKFTVIIETLGYLILDFHDKPKQFEELIGYIGMMHKDMNLELEDTNNFCTVMVDYLRDVMNGLMTDRCETAFVTFFRNIQELMMKSIAEERRRFALREEDDAPVVHSRFKALMPCAWSEDSNKLIYGQPREYWVRRQLDWKSKIRSWDPEMQPVPIPANVQNAVESTSSDDEGLEKVKPREESRLETRDGGYPEDENRVSFLLQRSRYLKNGRLVSITHFDRSNRDSSEADDLEESDLINNAEGRLGADLKLTPRERYRAAAVAVKAPDLRSSWRFMSSTDTGSLGSPAGSSARERRRSTWN